MRLFRTNSQVFFDSVQDNFPGDDSALDHVQLECLRKASSKASKAEGNLFRQWGEENSLKLKSLMYRSRNRLRSHHQDTLLVDSVVNQAFGLRCPGSHRFKAHDADKLEMHANLHKFRSSVENAIIRTAQTFNACDIQSKPSEASDAADNFLAAAETYYLATHDQVKKVHLAVMSKLASSYDECKWAESLVSFYNAGFRLAFSDSEKFKFIPTHSAETSDNREVEVEVDPKRAIRALSTKVQGVYDYLQNRFTAAANASEQAPQSAHKVQRRDNSKKVLGMFCEDMITWSDLTDKSFRKEGEKSDIDAVRATSAAARNLSPQQISAAASARQKEQLSAESCDKLRSLVEKSISANSDLLKHAKGHLSAFLGETDQASRDDHLNWLKAASALGSKQKSWARSTWLNGEDVNLITRQRCLEAHFCGNISARNAFMEQLSLEASEGAVPSASLLLLRGPIHSGKRLAAEGLSMAMRRTLIVIDCAQNTPEEILGITHQPGLLERGLMSHHGNAPPIFYFSNVEGQTHLGHPLGRFLASFRNVLDSGQNPRVELPYFGGIEISLDNALAIVADPGERKARTHEFVLGPYTNQGDWQHHVQLLTMVRSPLTNVAPLMQMHFHIDREHLLQTKDFKYLELSRSGATALLKYQDGMACDNYDDVTEMIGGQYVDFLTPLGDCQLTDGSQTGEEDAPIILDAKKINLIIAQQEAHFAEDSLNPEEIPNAKAAAGEE